MPRTEDDELLLLATDGLWDVFTNQVGSPTMCSLGQDPPLITEQLLGYLSLSRCLVTYRCASRHSQLLSSCGVPPRPPPTPPRSAPCPALRRRLATSR